MSVLSDGSITHVRAHPLVRLEPVGSGSFLLSRDDRRRGHRVSAVTAGAVVAGFRPTTVDEIVREIEGVLGIRPDTDVPAIVQWLIASDYLVHPSDPQAIATARWVEEWADRGWRAAAYYHARTFGYPFESYDVHGNSAEDTRRMVAYNAEEPDDDRAKAPVKGSRLTYGFSLPSTTHEAEQSASRGAPPASRPFNRVNVSELLALVAAPVATAAMTYTGAAPLLRKTSPSGGGRHPTEFYLVTNGVTGLDDAVYQVAAVECCLSSLDQMTTSTSEFLGRVLPNEVKVLDDRWALLLYSSMFGRNRYRYREPRTFRTVHMDVGHLMTTCAYVGRSRGWDVQQIQHLDGARLAHELGLNLYVECPIAGSLLTPARREL